MRCQLKQDLRRRYLEDFGMNGNWENDGGANCQQ